MASKTKHKPADRTADRRREWLDVDEAAEYLRISPRTVRRRVAAGDFVAHRVGKRLIRLDRAELDAALGLIPTVEAD